MDLSMPRELASPEVIADEVAGETLAINLATGAYYVIPAGGLAVWHAVSSRVPAASLLDGPDDPRRQSLSNFVETLVGSGLLRDASEAARSDRVEWQAEALVVEEHTDMADLLGLDPIHDADENVGWPMRQPE